MIYNQWYGVLPSKKVKKDQIVGVKRLNHELAFFRTSDGTLGCVEDKCSHRGVALSAGKVKGGCVQCPFHGIEFDPQGKCTFIPANGRNYQGNLERYKVKHYPVREKNGIIYLWYGDMDNLHDHLPFFDDQVNDSFAYSEIEDHWNSHYSRCIENQLDVVHIPFVHYNTIGRGNKTLVNGPALEVDGQIIVLSAHNAVDEGQKPIQASDLSIKETYLKFIYPNFWMNHISDKIKVIIYFAPVDEENTILYIRFYTKASPIPLINHLMAFFGKFANRTIERQDKRVVITQRPKASALKMEEKLIKGDQPIIMYRQLRQKLKEN